MKYSDEYKEAHSEIPWSMISGLRHRLIHDYDGTNWNIIVDVVFEELPLLIEKLEKLLYFIQGVYSALDGKPIFEEDCRAIKDFF